MRQIIPEVYVRDCRQALDFYSDLFGGTVKNLQMSDDLELFREFKNKVVHAELHVNTRCVFYFVDIFDEKRKQVGNMTLVLHTDSLDEAERLYEGLSERGEVGMPLQKTFWGQYHAIVTDRYGAPWALNFTPEDGKLPV